MQLKVCLLFCAVILFAFFAVSEARSRDHGHDDDDDNDGYGKGGWFNYKWYWGRSTKKHGSQHKNETRSTPSSYSDKKGGYWGHTSYGYSKWLRVGRCVLAAFLLIVFIAICGVLVNLCVCCCCRRKAQDCCSKHCPCCCGWCFGRNAKIIGAVTNTGEVVEIGVIETKVPLPDYDAASYGPPVYDNYAEPPATPEPAPGTPPPGYENDGNQSTSASLADIPRFETSALPTVESDGQADRFARYV